VLFELSYPDAAVARAAIDRAIQKLPIKARFVAKEEAL
jgi:large subunit ribosomal protein L16